MHTFHNLIYTFLAKKCAQVEDLQTLVSCKACHSHFWIMLPGGGPLADSPPCFTWIQPDASATLQKRVTTSYKCGQVWHWCEACDQCGKGQSGHRIQPMDFNFLFCQLAQHRQLDLQWGTHETQWEHTQRCTTRIDWPLFSSKVGMQCQKRAYLSYLPDQVLYWMPWADQWSHINRTSENFAWTERGFFRICALEHQHLQTMSGMIWSSLGPNQCMKSKSKITILWGNQGVAHMKIDSSFHILVVDHTIPLISKVRSCITSDKMRIKHRLPDC